MRTHEEIVKRIRDRQNEDILGWETQCYLMALPFELAKEFLSEGATEDQWTHLIQSDEILREQMIEYMPFAWGKANDQRGLSANRSIMHYQAWLWLAGVDGLDDMSNPTWGEYEYYGKPQLQWICRYLGLDPEQWDDGVRTNG